MAVLLVDDIDKCDVLAVLLALGDAWRGGSEREEESGVMMAGNASNQRSFPLDRASLLCE